MKFRNVLSERVAGTGIGIPGDQLAAHEMYFELLERWNKKINLTALPLNGAPLATVDRLFVEPLSAARPLFP
jgi:16S rRNA G527 N7-methylase RsmG